MPNPETDSPDAPSKGQCPTASGLAPRRPQLGAAAEEQARQATPYATDKIGWHPDRVAAMRKGEQAKPVGLQLIISDYCNHDCHFCAYRASNGLSSEQFAGPDKKGRPSHNPYRMIATDKVMQILHDAFWLGVKAITWTGGGEPTAHPDHLELFRTALEMGIECSLNTNGEIFRLGWKDVLPRFTYVRFSVDAGNANEYAQVRRVSPQAYRRVMRNLTALCAEVKDQGSPCVVGTGYVVSPTSHKYLLEGIANIRATGASYVRLASMQSTEGAAAYTPEEMAACREAIATAQRELVTDDFQVISLFDTTLGQQMADPFCGFQQLVTYIGANLKIYRCCYLAYTKAGECGDISGQSLREWFESEQKRAALGDFDARDCAICPLASKNEAITALVRGEAELPAGPPPGHVNFL